MATSTREARPRYGHMPHLAVAASIWVCRSSGWRDNVTGIAQLLFRALTLAVLLPVFRLRTSVLLYCARGSDRRLGKHRGLCDGRWPWKWLQDRRVANDSLVPGRPTAAW